MLRQPKHARNKFRGFLGSLENGDRNAHIHWRDKEKIKTKIQLRDSKFSLIREAEFQFITVSTAPVYMYARFDGFMF